MTPKTHQLQIRVTAEEKARLKRLARAAGQDVSAYVLASVLSPARPRVRSAVAALRRGGDRALALAELGDALADCADAELAQVLSAADLQGLGPLDQNHVGAMVETLFASRGLPAPRWLARVAPLSDPWFATDLPSVRGHLLRASPVAYRRRNLFVDATLLDRV